MSTERYIPESAVRELLDGWEDEIWRHDALKRAGLRHCIAQTQTLLVTAVPLDEIERLRLRETRLYELLNRCERDAQRALRVSNGECTPQEEYEALRGACEAIQQRAAGVEAPQGEAPEPEGLREIVTRLYQRAHWIAHGVPESEAAALWEAVRDAAHIAPGHSPTRPAAAEGVESVSDRTFWVVDGALSWIENQPESEDRDEIIAELEAWTRAHAGSGRIRMRSPALQRQEGGES